MVFKRKSQYEQVHLLDQAIFHLHLETSFRAQEINTMLHSKAVAVSVAYLHRPTVHLRLVSVHLHLVLAPPHQATALLLNLNLNLSPVATHQAIKVVLIKEAEDSLKEEQMDTLQVDHHKETKVHF